MAAVLLTNSVRHHFKLADHLPPGRFSLGSWPENCLASVLFQLHPPFSYVSPRAEPWPGIGNLATSFSFLHQIARLSGHVLRGLMDL